MTRFQLWAVPSVIMFSGLLIATSILFVGRWQISAVGYGYGSGDTASSSEVVYRLDRWTGRVEYCGPKFDQEKVAEGDPIAIQCPLRMKPKQS
jgi:hypothetical protein